MKGRLERVEERIGAEEAEITSGDNGLEFCHQTGQGNGELAVSLGFYESKKCSLHLFLTSLLI